MQMPIKFLQRSLLPIAVFAAVMGLHYVWTGRSLEGACIDETLPNGQTVCHELSGWSAYVESKSYWLGYSYGLSLAFAGVALRRYREQRLCADRNLAIGGVTLSGFLAVAGCFLVGCCGSPMLGASLTTRILSPDRSMSWVFCGCSGPMAGWRSTTHLLSATR